MPERQQRHVKAAATDDQRASTAGRISVITEARVTAPIKPIDQAELVVGYM